MKTSRIVFSSQQVKESFLKRVREGVNGVYGVGISPEVAEGIDNELTDKEKNPIKIVLEDCKTNAESFIREVAP